MRTLSFMRPGLRRAVFGGLVAAMLVFSMVTFPSVRATADSLLQTFRARSVLFLPVEMNRLQQLRNLRSDPTTLFVSKPEVVGTPKQTPVNSVDEDIAQLEGGLGLRPHRHLPRIEFPPLAAHRHQHRQR